MIAPSTDLTSLVASGISLTLSLGTRVDAEAEHLNVEATYSNGLTSHSRRRLSELSERSKFQELRFATIAPGLATNPEHRSTLAEHALAMGKYAALNAVFLANLPK